MLSSGPIDISTPGTLAFRLRPLNQRLMAPVLGLPAVAILNNMVRTMSARRATSIQVITGCRFRKVRKSVLEGAAVGCGVKLLSSPSIVLDR
jgi:hypothetical protein